jgi:putative spermidine/putrescine transport system permease protein
MENIHPSLEEASLSLGAPPVRTFFRVIIPLSTVGIVAGTLLCFILALNAYATPFLLGGPRFQMMAPALYQQITMVNNWPAGATLAFILLSVSLLLTLTMAYVVKKRVIR